MAEHLCFSAKYVRRSCAMTRGERQPAQGSHRAFAAQLAFQGLLYSLQREQTFSPHNVAKAPPLP